MTQDKDLSRLRIDRGGPGAQAARGRPKRTVVVALFAVALSALAAYYPLSNRLQEVEVATVTTAYPSQAFSLLNATGYVVAQRKAAVASKAAGRVEWLGVVEGSLVKEGEVVARLESPNGVECMIHKGLGYTPTPVISHAILVYNRGRKSGLGDGIIITPSHNPPGDGGVKYNPPHGGPAGEREAMSKFEKTNLDKLLSVFKK